MKYAVIAAGEGSRLSQEGIQVPKPLVEVGGEPLIDRLIRIFMDNDGQEIVVVCNENMPEVRVHLCHLAQDVCRERSVSLQIVETRTPSSMHSLYKLRPWLEDSDFCLTTVDTFFHEKEFKQYVDGFKNALKNDIDAWMGVTAYVDDEKPLYVETDETLRVTGFYDLPHQGCSYVSAGIYGFRSIAFETLERCIQRGEQRMRNFQRALLTSHLNVRAFAFGPVFDIDHVADIAKAEDFLVQQNSFQ